MLCPLSRDDNECGKYMADDYIVAMIKTWSKPWLHCAIHGSVRLEEATQADGTVYSVFPAATPQCRRRMDTCRSAFKENALVKEWTILRV